MAEETFHYRVRRGPLIEEDKVSIARIRVKVTEQRITSLGGYLEGNRVWLPKEKLVRTPKEAVEKMRDEIGREFRRAEAQAHRLHDNWSALNDWLTFASEPPEEN